MPNEKDQFAQDFENILDQPLNSEPAKVEEVVVEEDGEEAKNRRERRLRDKLQAEREANIAMAARLEALAEAKKASEDSETAEYTKLAEQIYGNDTPEKAAATQLLQSSLKGVEERATARALEIFREEQRAAQESVQQEEKTLESFVEAIEDEHNVTMTPEIQKGYFALLEKMSPKDTDGNIREYADPNAVWEVFSEKLQKRTDNNRAKDLASRSMTASGSSGDSKIQDDAMRRLLSEAGII